MLLKKHLRRNSHLFAYLRFRAFARVSLCRLVLLVLFSAFGAFGAFGAFSAFLCVRNLFVKKSKKFKTALTTSSILLLVICLKKRNKN